MRLGLSRNGCRPLCTGAERIPLYLQNRSCEKIVAGIAKRKRWDPYGKLLRSVQLRMVSLPRFPTIFLPTWGARNPMTIGAAHKSTHEAHCVACFGIPEIGGDKRILIMKTRLLVAVLTAALAGACGG